MKLINVPFFLVLLCLPIAGSAGMYRWTDDNGNVMYSQSPPEDGREAKSIGAPPPPAEAPEQARKDLEERSQALEDARKQREQAETKKREERKLAMEKRKNCDKARQSLDVLRNRPPTTRYRNEKGETVRYTEEQRQARIKQAEDYLKESCQ